LEMWYFRVRTKLILVSAVMMRTAKQVTGHNTVVCECTHIHGH
jgi:hypothetical protein